MTPARDPERPTTQVVIDEAEHASGLRPLGEYPDHCARCRRVSECDHTDTVEHSTWDGTVYAQTCACGVQLIPNRGL